MSRNKPLLTLVAPILACAGDFSLVLEGSSTEGATLETSPAEETSTDGSSTNATSSESSSGPSDPDTTGSVSEPSSESSSPDPDTTDGSSSAGCTDLSNCASCEDAPNPDAACAEAFPDRPLCEAGDCVQCSEADSSACEGTTPVCTAGSCVGCTYHAQCPNTACDISSGACFDDLCIRDVDGDGGETYSTISAAIADWCVIRVHGRDNDVPYTESVVVDGLTVAILVPNGEDPILQGVGGDPSLHVGTGSVVYLKGLRLRGNTEAEGVRIIDGSAYLDETQIVQNAGGGATSTGGQLHVRNSFIAGNGGNGFSATTGLNLNDTEVDISYATIAFNQGDGADSFQCVATTGSLRNSIVIGSELDPEPSSFSCPGVSADHTAFDNVIAGAGNIDVSPMTGAWFANPASDFHLTASGALVFANVALWSSGDPLEDIDGTNRPAVDGTADFAGADVP